MEGIEAGIFHDEGSGSNVDICIITKDKAEYLRNYVSHNQRAHPKLLVNAIQMKNTPVLDQRTFQLEKIKVDKYEAKEQMEVI